MDSLIVIVSHNGAPTISETIKHCLESIGALIFLVVDNASTDGTPEILKSFSDQRLQIQLFQQNLGVGAGFNRGLREAVRQRIPWLMILDQDSLLRRETLMQLIETGKMRLENQNRVGAVFPLVRCRNYPDIIHRPMNWTGKGFLSVTGAGHIQGVPLAVDTSISSGALYRVSALTDIGGFNEAYFIDFVDHECHLRLRQAGYTLWWDRNASMIHNLGKIQRMTPDGLWIEHEPFRYYYMARNMIYSYLRFGGARAVMGLFGEIIRHMKRLTRYGAEPKACNRQILKGVVDAILGKTGPLDTTA